MSISQLERRVLDAIDAHAGQIKAFAAEVLNHPELGYCEKVTSQLVRQQLEQLGLPVETGLAMTGVKATTGGAEGPNVCLIGELDAVKCADHPQANPATGVAHACGHHAQLAAMVGAAMGLVHGGVLPELAGRVTFFAVPAEEYIELEYRRSLKAQGKIQFFGGKQQLIYEGAFDDIDLAMMVHAHPDTPAPTVMLGGGSLGFMEKRITFHGKAAHASNPSEGVNALNAAALAILGMHANRERFREEDRIRVHPIITKGGDVVNSVPDEVCMDSYVRGANFPAVQRASADTDRAIHGAAAMVGATAEIQNQTGYFPLHQDGGLTAVFRSASAELLPREQILTGIDMVGSSDIGDLSQLMPCIQPTIGGFTGSLHSRELTAVDLDAAYILPAKLMALTVVRLLADGGRQAKEILDAFQPELSKAAYIQTLLQG